MAKRADVSRDLLFGLLAFQRGGVDRAGLAAAMRAWTPAGSRALSEVLVAQGVLDAPTRARIEGLVEGHLKRLSDDPALSATAAHVGPAFSGRDAAPTDTQARDPSRGSPDGGRFQVLRPHARGGLGEVFLALDPELNRNVALKQLRESHAHDPVSQSRFLLEAEVTGRLEHPGVVPVYGLGRFPDGRPYYATRFIEGETLRSAADRFHAPGGAGRGADAPELAFRKLLRAVIDASNTVAYAHSRGVVHRDLKPENIMLGPFGETLVVDWGVAKPLGDSGPEVSGWPDLSTLAEDTGLTRPGAAVGTPQYMSPEQAAGDHDRVGPASDVYGLGATLYYVLVGQVPFGQSDLASVLRRVLSGDFPPPRRVRKSVDAALEAVCLKAMALQPEDRHATPLALADALERWLADVRFRAEQELAVNQMKRTLVRLCLDRAHHWFGRERPGEGMLWLARALESVPADSPALQRVVRTDLAGWHAGKALMERCLGHGGEVHAVAFSPDGRRLVTACEDGKTQLWDAATGNALAPPMIHDGPARGVAFSPDGRVVATASDDGAVRRWDALTGKPIGRPMPHGAPVVAVGFSPDGSRIATASVSTAPCLWDAATGKPIATPAGHNARTLAVAFSADGTLLATACDDGHLWLWDTATGAQLGDPFRHDSPVSSLAFSHDGRTLLSGCADGKGRLWDLANRGPATEFAHEGAVGFVQFRPAGTAFATASHDGTARLWDADTASPVGEPLAHRARVHDLAFSHDGSMLATASWDGSARLWDADTGLTVGPPMVHRGTVCCLAFSPDGRRLVTGGVDHMARCWKVPVPVAGDAERISCWVRVSTNLDFDAGDAVRRLDGLKGWELRRRLNELGGPPLK